MEMRHLRAFLAVADELHFTRAARRLHIAQPAVSVAIRELEAELGASLFERSRRRVQLTAAGEHFRAAAQEALDGLERAVDTTQRVAAGEVGRVVLQLTTLAALSPLPAAIVRFRRARPGVQVIIEQRGTAEQLASLRAGQSDLAFTVMPGELGTLASRALTDTPLVAILSQQHPLASRPAVSFPEIATEPVLILPRRTEPAVHAAYSALCEQLGATPRIEMELDQIDTVLAFVASGMAISLAPASVARLCFPGVAYVPLEPVIPAGVTAVWSPDTLSPAGAALLEEIFRPL